jgi:hypothetical protein
LPVAPFLAVLVAGGYLLAATCAPTALAPLAVAAFVVVCGLALARRSTRRAVIALVVVAAWLGAALAGALLLRLDRTAGLLWIVLGLFLAPLPLIPWLYSMTFQASSEPRVPRPEPRTRTAAPGTSRE